MDNLVDYSSYLQWSIKVFKDFCERDNNVKYSELVTMPEDPSVKFVFHFIPGMGQADDVFGVIMKSESKISKSVNLRINFWILAKGNNVNFRKTAEHTFHEVGDECTFKIPIGLFGHDYHQGWGLDFCCDLKRIGTDLNSSMHFPFRQRLWNEYKKGLDVGVLIKVDKSEFKICREVLTCQSEVFSNMLSPIFKEGKTGEIDITDFDATTVEHFIKWLYLSEIDSEDTAISLFYLAEKYLIQELKEQCIQLLSAILTDTNVVQRLIWAVENDADELRVATINYLAEKKEFGCMLLLMSEDWLQFAHENKELRQAVTSELQRKLQA